MLVRATAWIKVKFRGNGRRRVSSATVRSCTARASEAEFREVFASTRFSHHTPQGTTCLRLSICEVGFLDATDQIH